MWIVSVYRGWKDRRRRRKSYLNSLDKVRSLRALELSLSEWIRKYDLFNQQGLEPWAAEHRRKSQELESVRREILRARVEMKKKIREVRCAT